MNLPERDRQLVEHALDEALAAPGEPRTRHLIERALRVVRERPEGVRRIRADAGTRRRGQLDVFIEEAS